MICSGEEGGSIEYEGRNRFYEGRVAPVGVDYIL